MDVYMDELAKLIGEFQFDAAALWSRLAALNGGIVGSAVLAAVLGTRWPDSDLDLAIPNYTEMVSDDYAKVHELARYLESCGYARVRIVRPEDEGDAYAPAAPWGRFETEYSLPRVRERVCAVTTWRHHTSGRLVQVLNLRCTLPEFAATSDLTLTAGWTDGAVLELPHMADALARRGSATTEADKDPVVCLAARIAKYTDRGFAIASSVPSDQVARATRMPHLLPFTFAYEYYDGGSTYNHAGVPSRGRRAISLGTMTEWDHDSCAHPWVIAWRSGAVTPPPFGSRKRNDAVSWGEPDYVVALWREWDAKLTKAIEKTVDTTAAASTRCVACIKHGMRNKCVVAV